MAERILVIEDDRRIRDLLRRGLIFEAYQVDTAEDGETGLRIPPVRLSMRYSRKYLKILF